jgi:uncharacterized phage-associated protein
MYSAKAIANCFLDLAESDGKKLTPMQIQKLVYFAHGWNLAIRNEPLIDERVEAWQFGPVIPSLYHEFKTFGGSPVTSHALDIDWATFKAFRPTIESQAATENNQFTIRLLDRIWKQYGSLSGAQLSSLTHQAGTPWVRAREEFGEVRNVDIPDLWIRDYFLKVAANKGLHE